MTLIGRIVELLTTIGADIKALITSIDDHKTETAAHGSMDIEVKPPITIGDGSVGDQQGTTVGQSLGLLNAFISQTKGLLAGDIGNRLHVSMTGSPGGFPVLDDNQKIYEFYLNSPFAFLATEAALPMTDSGKTLYVTLDTKKIHFWNTATSAYVVIGGSSGGGITTSNVAPVATENGEWFNHNTGKSYVSVPTATGFVWAEQSGEERGGVIHSVVIGNIDGGNAFTNYGGSTPINGGNAFTVF